MDEMMDAPVQDGEAPKTDVEIVYVRPGELEYDGHRPRFTEEKRESVQ